MQILGESSSRGNGVMLPEDVPPWNELKAESDPDKAAAAAAQRHGIHDAASLIALVWYMRRVARGSDERLGGD